MAKAYVKKEMLIGDLILKYPACVGVLLENGFHCIGCAISPYETLEQGAAVHGWEKKQLKEIIKAMDKAIEADIKFKADMERKAKGRKEKAAKL